MQLNEGKWGQRELAMSNCSMILQSAWSRYGTQQQRKENILQAWPLILQSAKATGNFKLLGKVAPIIKRLRANVITPTDTWFYAFLLMVEDEEVRGVGFRRQRYVEPRRR